MSFYYKYKFVNPEPLFAIVKEEMKSYFDTGSVDDTLFPEYVDQCLKKLSKSSYPINQAMLCIDTNESRLPDDFYAVREAWACTDVSKAYQLPNATYTQLLQQHTRIDGANYVCTGCGDNEPPDIIQAIYKTTNTVMFKWRKEYLLTPGNAYPACPKDLFCANYNAIACDSYDIRDNKFVTTFRTGKVYIQYYSNDFDRENQLVPDEYRVQEFIKAFLKQKMYEQLANQTTDETYKQIHEKYLYYKQLSDEAYILADTEDKKEDVYRKERAINRVRRRFNKYNIK
jgi:hypothetical protein